MAIDPHDWQHQTHRRAALVHDQLRAIESRLKTMPDVSAADMQNARTSYLALLDKLYIEDFPLARLMDEADLLVRADGEATSNHNPSIDVVSWLCEQVGRNLRALLRAALQITDNKDHPERQYDLRLTGLAPGSLYLGFGVAPPKPPPLFNYATVAEDERLFQAARTTVRSLPAVPQYLVDGKISDKLVNEMPDAAMRDASLVAAFRLAPTGRRGIDTVEFSAVDEKGTRHEGALTSASRNTLRVGMRHNPLFAEPKKGCFEGEVREIDLDTQRFKIRLKDGLLLRCAFSIETRTAKNFLGSWVKVEGLFDAGVDGRPRLMKADKVDIVTPSLGLNLSD